MIGPMRRALRRARNARRSAAYADSLGYVENARVWRRLARGHEQAAVAHAFLTVAAGWAVFVALRAIGVLP